MTKRSADINRLIAQASDPATPTATAVTDARRVALALAAAGGPWTQQAARGVLGGDDDLAMQFVRTGIAFAASQDDRASVEAF